MEAISRLFSGGTDVLVGGIGVLVAVGTGVFVDVGTGVFVGTGVSVGGTGGIGWRDRRVGSSRNWRVGRLFNDLLLERNSFCRRWRP